MRFRTFLSNALNARTPIVILRSIDNARSYFQSAVRQGEATANPGCVSVSSTDPRACTYRQAVDGAVYAEFDQLLVEHALVR